GDVVRRPLLQPTALDILVDLARAFDQEEQAAGDENEVAPGKVVTRDAEDRRREMNDIGDAAKHDDAEDERERQTDAPRHEPLLRRHAGDQERDEHDIVDAKYDLQRAQRDEARPGMRISQEVEEHGPRNVGGREDLNAKSGPELIT